MENKSYQKGTAAEWAGEENVSVKGAATTPIVNAVAFSYTDLDEWRAVSLGKTPGYFYSRNTNFGGILSFSLAAGYDAVKKFLPRLKLVHLAASLGYLSPLAGPRRITRHVELTEAQPRLLGIPEGLIRYSVGIENVTALQADLEQALARL